MCLPDFSSDTLSAPLHLPNLAPRSFALSRCSVNTCWVVDTGLHVNPSSSKGRTRPILKNKHSFLLKVALPSYPYMFILVSFVAFWGRGDLGGMTQRASLT